MIRTQFNDQNSQYSYNSALFGGVFYLDNTISNLSNISIHDTFAVQGGVLYIQDLSPTNFSNSKIENSVSTQYGGVFSINQPKNPIGSSSFNLTYVNISNTFAGISGGSFYIDSTQLKYLNLYQSQFLNSSAVEYGGVLCVLKMDGLLQISSDNQTLQKSLFQQFKANLLGSLLYSSYSGFYMTINNTIIESSSTFDLNHVKQKLDNLQYDYAGAVYVANSILGVSSYNNEYRYCYFLNQGAVFTFKETKFNDINSSYHQNAAIGGGVILCESCQMNIQNSDFQRNYAFSGGVFVIDNQARVNITQSIFTNNTAVKDGGVFMVIKSKIGALDSSWIVISDIQQTQFNKADLGGFLSSDNSYMQINLTRITFAHELATSKGGIIHIADALSFTIQQSNLSNFESPEGAAIFSQSPNVQINLYNNLMMCNPDYLPILIQEYLNLTDPLYQLQSNILIKNAKLIDSRQNLFKHCFITNFGGVFTLLNTNFQDSKSKYYLNAGAQGGVFYLQQANASIQFAEFDRNIGNIGGVIQMNQNSYLSVSSSYFTNNQAYYSAGVIYVTTESHFDINGTIFNKNQASEVSTINVLKSSLSMNNTLIKCEFTQNKAIKNTLTLMYSKTQIIGSIFKDNEATQRSKNLFIGFSEIYVINTKFIQTYSDELKSKIYSGQEKIIGTFIFVLTDVDIEITNSEFTNGFAIIGGAIYLSGFSNLKIIKSIFNNNQAKANGGAIYAVGFSSIYIGNETNFQQNIAIDGGDDIFVANTDKNLTLFKVNIVNPKAKNSINAEQCGVNILNSTISNIYNSKSTHGAGLQCFNCRNIYIAHSSFHKLQSQLGGALYIEESEVNKKAEDNYGKYVIENSIFQSCQASTTGGALFLRNIQYLTILNSNFKENAALFDSSYSKQEISGSGGAIYYTCDETYLYCNLKFAGINVFNNNRAGIKGGAIYWDSLEPKFFKNQMIFSGNKAQYYGDNIACYSQQLVMINQTLYIQLQIDLGVIKKDEMNLLRQLNSIGNQNQDGEVDQLNGKIKNQRSGGEIPQIYLAHIDKYGQIQSSDFSSKVKAYVNAETTSNSKSQLFPPIIKGTTTFETIAGMVIVQGLSFSASPGNKYTISFNSDGIDLRKSSNQEFMKLLGDSKINLDSNIILELRDCNIGEQFTEEGQCIKCPDQQSFSLVKMTSPGECESCPSDKALCYGGSNVGPRPGFWRTTNSSSLFIQCLYEPSCLGMVEPENNPIGSCQIGYQGVLCADCAAEFSRTGDFECSKCPQRTINIVRLTFIVLAFIVGVVIIFGLAQLTFIIF
ncbi:UNKNOWN [Stylonychia lemnae]|uniref:Transmembrane protein n=1 Tax=Stylonychia lemnae TaxID=5949 RepID=A0A078A160_STYLE|nr:UNKNOWN [Stylonychia lemnae]|eukprot:CDW75587.1 UNKNOWN [Stylonychia lemnae]